MSALSSGIVDTDWSNQSNVDRLSEVLSRTKKIVGPTASAQLDVLLSRGNLEVMAAFLAGYIGLHFIGVGAFADIVMGVSGWVMMGAAIFTGLDQLYKFAYLTLRGRTDRDLNDAARSLAEAIATLGLTAVLNFLGGKVARRGKVSDAFSGKTEKFKSFKEYLSKKIEQDGNKPPKTTYLSSKSDLDSHNWRP
ncbi:hypothetical protein J2D73_05470 [Acetobacter sacchari]|uniref:Holin n=1 Tax=Acetobacter sacchari TaxID=2661687 RepID=A0ABS3LTK8_9PROT|nr:hypothetical protein [Acetobacter sacchari]MBO1359245.1 hypothetical protein [Acetobacter sacchari]